MRYPGFDTEASGGSFKSSSATSSCACCVQQYRKSVDSTSHTHRVKRNMYAERTLIADVIGSPVNPWMVNAHPYSMLAEKARPILSSYWGVSWACPPPAALRLKVCDNSTDYPGIESADPTTFLITSGEDLEVLGLPVLPPT